MAGAPAKARRAARRAHLQPDAQARAAEAARLAAMTPRQRRRYLKRHGSTFPDAPHVCPPDGCDDPGAHYQGEDDPTV